MVCVELNPVRVKVAKRLEASDDTSISLLRGHYTVADPAVRNTVDLQITALFLPVTAGDTYFSGVTNKLSR
jgi:hypothetical protein